jgi:S1-C subfamily serine protease
MMRTVQYAAALLVWCVSVIGVAEAGTATRSPAQQSLAAVEVTVECPDRPRHGSGVVVDRGHVLTAAHVAPCMGARVVVVQGGRSFEMRIERIDLRHDIALLAGSDLDAPPVLRGTWIMSTRVCFEARVPRVMRSCGKVRPNPYPLRLDRVNHEAITWPGNSGSGVYDDAGRLVGIVTDGRPNSTGGLFTPLGAGWLR